MSGRWSFPWYRHYQPDRVGSLIIILTSSAQMARRSEVCDTSRWSGSVAWSRKFMPEPADPSGEQACREWTTLSSFTLRTTHQRMGTGLASVEQTFCSQPNRFLGAHTQEKLHLVELAVWPVTTNSPHAQNSEHLWRLFPGPLPQVRIPGCQWLYFSHSHFSLASASCKCVFSRDSTWNWLMT